MFLHFWGEEKRQWEATNISIFWKEESPMLSFMASEIEFLGRMRVGYVYHLSVSCNKQSTEQLSGQIFPNLHWKPFTSQHLLLTIIISSLKHLGKYLFMIHLIFFLTYYKISGKQFISTGTDFTLLVKAQYFKNTHFLFFSAHSKSAKKVFSFASQSEKKSIHYYLGKSVDIVLSSRASPRVEAPVTSLFIQEVQIFPEG